MTIVMAISSCVTAFATIGMFCWAGKAHRLNKTIKNERAKRDEETSDLFGAIVIATLLSGNSSPDQFHSFKEKFKEQYRGKTPIFRGDEVTWGG